MHILKESPTRQEYKRRWKAIARAKNHGLNTDLIDCVYGILLERGFEHEAAFAAIILAARDGVFNFVNAWER